MPSQLFMLLGEAEMSLERNGVTVVGLMGSDGAGETKDLSIAFQCIRGILMLEISSMGQARKGPGVVGWPQLYGEFAASYRKEEVDSQEGDVTSSSTSFQLFVSFYAWLCYLIYVLNEAETFVSSGICCQDANTSEGYSKEVLQALPLDMKKRAWPPILGGMLSVSQ